MSLEDLTRFSSCPSNENVTSLTKKSLFPGACVDMLRQGSPGISFKDGQVMQSPTRVLTVTDPHCDD